MFLQKSKITFVKENVLPPVLILSHGVSQAMRFIHHFSYYSLQHKSFYPWYAAFSKSKFSACASVEVPDKTHPLYFPAHENQNEANHLAVVSQKYTPTLSLAVLPRCVTL